MNSLGYDELAFYQFLETHHEIPSLNIADQWTQDVQNRVDLLQLDKGYDPLHPIIWDYVDLLPSDENRKFHENLFLKHKRKTNKLTKKVKTKKVKNSKLRLKSDSSRSQSRSGADRNKYMKDEYVTNNILGKRSNIFFRNSDINFKCNSHGM